MQPHLDRLDRLDHARTGAAAFVLSLREHGILDTALLRAMETVPREHFAPRRFADLARADVALPLPFGQTMTSPSSVALMVAALGVRAGQRILEIGTGTGYVAALLARMGGEVRSCERRPALAEGAARRLGSLGFGREIQVLARDGLADLDREVRADRILLNGVLVGPVPAGLTSRLVAGGRLVGAILTEAGPRLLTIVREADGGVRQALGGPLRLARLTIGSVHDVGVAATRP